MNIDGLHRALPALGALTLEMHGCAREAVCEACAGVSPLTPALGRAFRAAPALPPRCRLPACGGALRPRVMLYNDPNEGLITPSFDDSLAADLAAADAVLWVGISFEQSASVEHFRRCRRALQAAGAAARVPHLVVNPSADAAFNLASAVANAEELTLLAARCSADVFLGALAGLAQEKEKEGVRKGPRGKRRRGAAPQAAGDA
jgi:NAD-dependent SIR2 family protein deacetylase